MGFLFLFLSFLFFLKQRRSYGEMGRDDINWHDLLPTRMVDINLKICRLVLEMDLMQMIANR